MCRHVFRWGHPEWGRSKFSKRAARTNSWKTVLAFFVGGRKGRPFGFPEEQETPPGALLDKRRAPPRHPCLFPVIGDQWREYGNNHQHPIACVCWLLSGAEHK